MGHDASILNFIRKAEASGHRSEKRDLAHFSQALNELPGAIECEAGMSSAEKEVGLMASKIKNIGLMSQPQKSKDEMETNNFNPTVPTL